MQLKAENEFGNIIAEFSFTTLEYKDDFIERFLIPVLKILEEYELLIPYYFDSAGILKGISKLTDEPRPSRALVHGIGHVIGEGYYIDPIYIAWTSINGISYISIKCTITNFLKYNIDTEEQKYYLENSKIMRDVLNIMSERIFNTQDWGFDIESKVYSTPIPEENFIDNVRLEDGTLENIAELVRPVLSTQPLSREDAEREIFKLFN